MDIFHGRFRLRRRVLSWLVPVGAGSTFLIFTRLVYTGIGSASVTVIGLVLAACCLRYALVVLRGYTEIDAGSVRNRLILWEKRVPLDQLRTLYVVPTFFGRRIVLISRIPGEITRVPLAAPREGLLAPDARFDAVVDALRDQSGLAVKKFLAKGVRGVYAGVLLLIVAMFVISAERLWLEPWWPTRHEATKMPHACELVDPVTAQRLGPGTHQPAPAKEEHHDLARSTCSWSGSGESGSVPVLSVTATLYRRAGDYSGTSAAEKAFANTQDLLDPVQVGLGIGDASMRVIDVRDQRVWLLVRHANVLLVLKYEINRTDAHAIADADALARTAIDRLTRT